MQVNNPDPQLWAQLKQKVVEIRRLNSVIDDLKGRVKVYCRVRPFNVNDKKSESEVELIEDTFIQIK